MGVELAAAPAADIATDRVLARAVASGDMAQARAFYDAHVRRVHALVYRCTGDADLTKDLTQDIFIRAFERIGQYRGEVPLGAWVRAVALSVTFNALKVRRRQWQRDAVLDDAVHATPSASADVWADRRLREALAELPDQSRAVVLLHDVEGYTHEEIAETLGIAPGTSRAILSRSRAQLRGALSNLGEARKSR